MSFTDAAGIASSYRDERDPDPEVIADLELREKTLRDRPGRRDGDLVFGPPVFVGAWPCRTCDVLVPITAFVMDRWAQFNAMLMRRAEEPLDPNKILFCDDCAALHRVRKSESRRASADEMARLVKLLKSSNDPMRETTCIEQIKALRHPDVGGLLNQLALRTKRKSAAHAEKL